MFNIGDIVLDGIDLNNSLQWTDRFDHSPVAQQTKRTLGGGLVVYSAGLNIGQPITLVASADTGWFTLAMVDAIKAIAEDPTGVYVFEYQGEFYDVQFNHAEPPAVSFQPLQPKAILDSDSYFTGTVKLFTV